MFKTHLRRTQHMPGRMQAQPHPKVVDDFAVFQRLQIDRTQARAHHALAGRAGQIVGMA